MNRRTFIQTTAATSIALCQTGSLLAIEAENTYRKDIGIKLYTLRNELGKDPAGTLKKVAAAGYKQVFIKEFAADMQFEIDVFWVKAAGLDPVELIKKLHGRVSQLHLKDLKDGLKLPSYSTGLPVDAFQEIGDGIIPMEPILVAAKSAGVVHCHVEQDQSPDALASIQQSMAYLRKL